MGNIMLYKTNCNICSFSSLINSSEAPCWFPGSNRPAYLDGKLPGDFGFDPLRLGSYDATMKWFRESEIQHCRWSMLGVAGILAGEISRPDINFFSAPVQLEGSFSLSISTLIVIEIILMHYVELRRFQDFNAPGSVNRDHLFKDKTLDPHDVGYPGGIFDPMGLSKRGLEELKEK